MTAPEAQDVPVVAVRRQLEDPSTAAVVEVHVIRMYSVDIANGASSATLAGYVSDAARLAGRSPVNHTTVTTPGTPPVGEDPVQWFYTQILSAPADNPANTLSGATPIYRGE